MKRGPKDVRPGKLVLPHADQAEAIVAALRPHLSDTRAARIDAVVARRISSVTLVLDRMHDPHNAGAILRSADAFGLISIHAVEPTEPFVVARRSTQGTHKWIGTYRHPDAQSALYALRAEGFALWVASADAARGAEDLPREEKIALCFGNEHDGVSAPLRDAAAGAFALPMRGFVESFNVSVAVALALAAVTATRGGDLSDIERSRLRAAFYRRSVRGADAIAARRGISLRER